MSAPHTLLPNEVLQAMIAAAMKAPAGHIVEVGVYRGGSAWWLAGVAEARNVPIHLFDTFSGMPHAADEDPHKVGEFADTNVAAIEQLIPAALIYPGVFPGTLPWSLQNIAFVHCDVDQYESTRDVIATLWPRMLPGGIMWFDDMELVPARRAVDEYFSPEKLLPGPQGRLWVPK